MTKKPTFGFCWQNKGRFVLLSYFENLLPTMYGIQAKTYDKNLQKKKTNIKIGFILLIRPKGMVRRNVLYYYVHF